jgi:hypothetical protein
MSAHRALGPMIFVWRPLGMSRKFLLPFLAAGLALAACGLARATPSPVPFAVTVFRQGTGTPAGGATLAPAATTAPAAATPAPVYGPDSYPDNVNPLTGEIVDPAQLNRLPVAVKISNFPFAVRPQSGLSLADLVFEHQAEAGLTRFTAIFLQNDAARIGSIRSARFIDTELVPMFGALLVTSGSSYGTMDHLRANPYFAGDNVWRLVSEETHYTCPPLCRSLADDSNTLFASTTDVRAATAARAAGQRADLKGLQFAGNPPPGGTPVDHVFVDFSQSAHVDWRYNLGSGRWDRWQDETLGGGMIAHFDALTNQPISAANVVVLYANHVNNFVPEDPVDVTLCGLEIQLWTAGPARVFRDGKMFEGHWQRDADTGWHLVIKDEAGNLIPFKPGNTWFDLVGLNASSALGGTTFNISNRVTDTRYGCPVQPTATPTETPFGYVAPLETETPAPT